LPVSRLWHGLEERPVVSRTGVLVSILLTWTGSASAQDANGHVEGRVLTIDARPAPAVRVAASSPSLQLHQEVETDARGYFRLSALPVGTYQLRLALVGYRPVVFEGVTVRLGRTTSLGETRLEPQAFELGEIVVNAERPLVDLASAASVTNIPSEQFENLPTARDFRSIVSLAPQADLSLLPGDEVNVAGGTGPENAYYLDGVNTTDPRLGATSSNLPYNFVRELQVKAGGYEAEFGRASGGIIDVITHSGGNRFGGQVFAFFTGNGLTSEPRFAVTGTEEHQFAEYDVGGSLGGPVVRDRLWFFVAYNPSFRRQQVEVNGPELPDDRFVQHLFAAKLTWAPGPRTDVAVTVHGDPSRQREFPDALLADSVANPEAVTRVNHQGGIVLSARARREVGKATQIELGVARVTRNDNVDAESEFGRTEPRFDDFTTGLVSGGLWPLRREHATRVALRGAVTTALGRHTVKAGVEYEDNQNEEEIDLSFIHRLDETTYTWHHFRSRGSPRNRVWTVYAQDSWRVGERITFNAGLRWDGAYLIGTEGAVTQRFTDQWQPRAGFTYPVSRMGTQKIFGSYGRFYEQLPLLMPGFYFGGGEGAISDVLYDHDPRIDPSGGQTTHEGVAGTQPSQDLEGQHFDEFTLGYERAIGREFRVGVRGMYRRLRWALEDALNPATEQFMVGNPGRGNLAFAPRARRTYSALVLTFEKPVRGRFGFLASYVLSRSRGNYYGLYDFDQGTPFPNTGSQFDLPEQYINNEGRLPNDRPHSVKFSGSYAFDFGVTLGTAIAWMSGMPRDEFAFNDDGYFVFLQPRGTAGRTESVLDASIRLTYALPAWRGTTVQPKVYLDLFHLGNRRTALRLDDVHYLAVDADRIPSLPNPTYGRPEVFQSPMSARLGVTVDFGTIN
jgi:hypothetical protein